MPHMDYFVDALTCEKYKSVQMGALKSSKAHELAANENSTNKLKQRVKGEKDPDPEKDSFHKPIEETSNPKSGKSTKDKVTCGY